MPDLSSLLRLIRLQAPLMPRPALAVAQSPLPLQDEHTKQPGGENGGGAWRKAHGIAIARTRAAITGVKNGGQYPLDRQFSIILFSTLLLACGIPVHRQQAGAAHYRMLQDSSVCGWDALWSGLTLMGAGLLRSGAIAIGRQTAAPSYPAWTQIGQICPLLTPLPMSQETRSSALCASTSSGVSCCSFFRVLS